MNDQVYSDIRVSFGAMRLSRKVLEEAIAAGRKHSISVAGILWVDSDVTPEMAEKGLGYVMVNGMVCGPAETKAVITEKDRRCSCRSATTTKKGTGIR